MIPLNRIPLTFVLGIVTAIVLAPSASALVLAVRPHVEAHADVEGTQASASYDVSYGGHRHAGAATAGTQGVACGGGGTVVSTTQYFYHCA